MRRSTRELLTVDICAHTLYYMKIYIHYTCTYWYIYTFNYNMITSSNSSSSGGRGWREVLSPAT